MPKTLKTIEEDYEFFASTYNLKKGFVSLASTYGKERKKIDWTRRSFRKFEAQKMLRSKYRGFMSYEKLVRYGAITPKIIDKATTMIDGEQLEMEFLRREILMYLQSEVRKNDSRKKSLKEMDKKPPKAPIYIPVGDKELLIGEFPEKTHRILTKLWEKIAPHMYVVTDRKCPYHITVSHLKGLFKSVSNRNINVAPFDFIEWAKKVCKYKTKQQKRDARKNRLKARKRKKAGKTLNKTRGRRTKKNAVSET